MFQIPISEIIEKISEASGLSAEDIKKKINEKMKSLEGLISEEGAAHIIAHELGVELFKAAEQKEIKIKDIIIGMRNFEISGVVSRIFEIRSFKKRDGTGRVCSFILNDETGKVRVILWNDMVKLIENNKISKGKTITIKNGFIKSNNYNGIESKEIHTNTKTRFEFNPDIKINVKLEENSEREEYHEKTISELNENDSAKIRATIINAYLPKIYLACPECNKKLIEENEKLICNEHGEVEAKKTALLSMIVDDGTENIRVVAFRETAEKILDMNAEQILNALENPTEFEIELQEKLLGKEILIAGRVKINKQQNNKEIMISFANKNLNPIQIATTLLGV